MNRCFPLPLLALLASAACSETASGPPAPPPDSGTMHVHISGAVTHDSTWSAFGQFRDLLAADTGELSLLGGQSFSTRVDRHLTLVFPGRLDLGTFDIGRYGVGAPTSAEAYVVIGSSFYGSLPGGQINVTAADYPPRPGLDEGLVSGVMTFHAVRLVTGPGGGPVETHDTIQVQSKFVAHWEHLLRPNVAVTLTGGPQLGSSAMVFGESLDDDHGGRYVAWDGNVSGAPPAFPYEISQEIRLAAPAVGMYTVGQLTPVAYANPAQWPSAFSALYYRDDPRIGLSAGGTLTITRFLAPTDAYYGEIQGTLEAPLALWVNDSTVTADTVHASVQFDVQLWPLGGIPVSPFTRAGSSARLDPLASPQSFR